MLKDVKRYYYQVQANYLAAKDDLKDFEQDFRDGRITEDQVQGLKDEITILEENYNRLSYIMHLFNIPKKEAYRKKYRKQNSYLEAYFRSIKADEDSVIKENEDALKRLKEELKKLTGKKDANKE